MLNYASKEQKLMAKVEAVNINNEFTNEFSKILINFFNPFINQKILKSDSELLKSIHDQLKTLTNDLLEQFKIKYPNPKYNILFFRYRNDQHKYSRYSLNYTIKTNVNVYEPYTDESATNVVYIADLNTELLNTISKTHQPTNYKTNYTFNELKFQQQQYFNLKREVENKQIELFNFIEDIEAKKYT